MNGEIVSLLQMSTKQVTLGPCALAPAVKGPSVLDHVAPRAAGGRRFLAVYFGCLIRSGDTRQHGLASECSGRQTWAFLG